MSLSPYQPSEDQTHVEETLPHVPLDQLARRIFLAWERLRIVYNSVLVITVLCVGTIYYLQYRPTALPLTGILGIIIPCIGANLCFFAGPIVETYVAWLGNRTETLRLILMLLGTGLSMLIAIVWTILLLNPQL
ncbi:MAG: hypothetical protein JNM43_06370 [Planctomycetaceae bacterium]|nr:hypothetical protein [Planctomycetaceae bacterium]